MATLDLSVCGASAKSTGHHLQLPVSNLRKMFMYLHHSTSLQDRHNFVSRLISLSSEFKVSFYFDIRHVSGVLIPFNHVSKG